MKIITQERSVLLEELRSASLNDHPQHKVAKNLAQKSKPSMGWFYGFKLHLIANELMHILNFRITPGNVDDRKGLEMMWNTIFGMIVADAGYLGGNWQEKAKRLGKQLDRCPRKHEKNHD